MQYDFTIIFAHIEEGFHVIVPALPEVVTYGRTMEEAQEMA